MVIIYECIECKRHLLRWRFARLTNINSGHGKYEYILKLCKSCFKSKKERTLREWYKFLIKQGDYHEAFVIKDNERV